MTPTVPVLSGDDEMPEEVRPSQPTRAFGPVESSDETRQAQHTNANDTPTDVNMNAIVARSQALTVDIAGKSFTGNADRREKIADQMMSKIQ